MKIYEADSKEFAEYGKILKGYDTTGLLKTLDEKTPLPEGTGYVASQPELEKLPIMKILSDHAYGGMPIQIGWCNGHNFRLNCLEYHKDSEINIGLGDFILFLAKEWDVEDGKLDTGKVKAFRVRAGEVVEVYSTTLHYAPCDAEAGKGFKVVVVLPKGTNADKPDIDPLNDNEEDRLLWAENKWLLAHKDSAEAKAGAVIALEGENISIEDSL